MGFLRYFELKMFEKIKIETREREREKKSP